jgi:hypothetical protein
VQGLKKGYRTCSRSFEYSCLLGLLAPVTDGLSTYVQEPLVIGRRGCTERDLNEKILTADTNSPVRKLVVYESDVSRGVQMTGLF